MRATPLQRRARAVAVVLVLGGADLHVARADEPAQSETPTPFDRLGWNVVDAFSGANLLFHGGAVAATGVMAFGGADHALRLVAQRDLRAPAYGDASYVAGYVLPLTLAPALYVVGLVTGDRTLAAAGAATLQALAVTGATTGILKWATGRPYPTHGGDPDDPRRLDHPEYARELSFQPFTLDRGFAWPSGHTSSPIAVAAALTAYYPEAWWVPAIGYPVSLAIGLGMVVGDRHWASDVVAGALIGHAIGYTVGRSFRRRYREGRTEAQGVQSIWIVPLAGATYGAALAGEL
jgi:membrane-associated phospholipid phosphatase